MDNIINIKLPKRVIVSDKWRRVIYDPQSNKFFVSTHEKKILEVGSSFEEDVSNYDTYNLFDWLLPVTHLSQDRLRHEFEIIEDKGLRPNIVGRRISLYESDIWGSYNTKEKTLVTLVPSETSEWTRKRLILVNPYQGVKALKVGKGGFRVVTNNVEESHG